MTPHPAPQPRSALARLDAGLGTVLRAIPIACLAALFVILLGNVLSRYFQIWSIAWFDEIVQALFAWMVFVGAAALWRENDHFHIDWAAAVLSALGSVVGLKALRLLITTLGLAFLVVMTWKGWELTSRSRAVTPILSLPVAWVYVVIPISGAIMCAYSLRDLVVLLRPAPKPALPSDTA
ncbi:MAG: TRAP transporter small permease [Pseudomonadota bacterium]